MIAKARDRALSLGAKIHPLMGPVFTSRPNSSKVGDTCKLCVGDTARPADTTLRTKQGQPAFVCLEHDLLLHKAIHDLDQIMSDYEAEVLSEVIAGSERPLWMPKRIYSKLQERAEYWVHVFTLQVFADLMKNIFEQHSQRVRQEIENHRTRKD